MGKDILVPDAAPEPACIKNRRIVWHHVYHLVRLRDEILGKRMFPISPI